MQRSLISRGGLALSTLTAILMCLLATGSAAQNHVDALRTPTTAADSLYAAMALVRQFKAAGHLVVQQGNLIKAGAHQIRLAPRIENERQMAGKWLVGLGVAVAVDGKVVPAMGAGSIGIDSTRDAALQTAATEWSQQFGSVLVRALFPRPTDRNTAHAGSYRVYIGPIGVRGHGDMKNFDASLKQMAAAVETFIARTYPQANHWHGVVVGVVPNAPKGQPIMCQVDGAQSAPLASAIQSVSWPSSATNIMIKQFFLAVPAK